MPFPWAAGTRPTGTATGGCLAAGGSGGHVAELRGSVQVSGAFLCHRKQRAAHRYTIQTDTSPQAVLPDRSPPAFPGISAIRSNPSKCWWGGCSFPKMHFTDALVHVQLGRQTRCFTFSSPWCSLMPGKTSEGGFSLSFFQR